MFEKIDSETIKFIHWLIRGRALQYILARDFMGMISEDFARIRRKSGASAINYSKTIHLNK